MQTGTHEIWLADLSEFPIEKLREAFKIERRSAEHEWPTVGHVMAHLESVESLALEEFAKIERFRGWHPDIGWTDPRTWGDVANRSLNEVGGIIAVMDATEKSLPFVRREFLAAYERNKNIRQVERPMLESDIKKVLGEK